MNKMLSILFSLMLTVTGFMGCDSQLAENDNDMGVVIAGAEQTADEENQTEDDNKGITTINLIVGSDVFSAKLYENESCRQFAAQLPVTYDMSELNSNEKFCYLPDNLPADSQRPGTIQTGDIMLYGSNCLVVFYETFNSSYSYTPLGYVEDIDGFAEALGSGSVMVTFELRR